MKNSIQELRELLNSAPLNLLTRSTSAPYVELSQEELDDEHFAEDEPRPTTGLTPAQLGALYNYLLIARGSAGGIHNPRYVRQLIYDSYTAVSVGNVPPPSLQTRP
jgi:hypothetical protein